MQDRQKRLLALIAEATGKPAHEVSTPDEGEDASMDDEEAEAALTIAVA